MLVFLLARIRAQRQRERDRDVSADENSLKRRLKMNEKECLIRKWTAMKSVTSVPRNVSVNILNNFGAKKGVKNCSVKFGLRCMAGGTLCEECGSNCSVHCDRFLKLKMAMNV
jgi:hypothetical protein